MSLPVFDLTPLIRGAASERRAVIKGFEVRWQTLVVGMSASIPALLVTLILWRPFGNLAVFAMPAVIGAALWLFIGRSNKGMNLKNWQSLRHRVASDTGKFYVSGQQYDPLANVTGVIYQRSAHVGADRPARAVTR